MTWTRWRRPLEAVVALSILAVLPGPWVPAAHADSTTGDSFALTAWPSEAGELPGDVFAIAQDAQGYLWLGGPTGLVRFDGADFRRWPIEEADDELPPGPVHTLIGTADGSLWVGFGGGAGIARLQHGRVTRFTPDDGAPAAANDLLQDRRGAIWATSRNGVFRYADGVWTAVGEEVAIAGQHAVSLHEDSTGAIWVSSVAGVYRLDEGRAEVVDASATTVDAIAEDASGAIWISDFDRFVRRLETGDVPRPGPGVRGPAGAWRALRDSDGGLWVAAWSSLMRISDPEAPEPVLERVAYEHRMAGSPRALFEDRDGNVWVGMRGGLLRLARTSLRPVDGLSGLTNEGVRTMAAGFDGSVWVATAYALNRFEGTSSVDYDVARTMALHADRQGLWLSTPERFGRFADGKFLPVTVPGEFYPRRILAMTTDAAGRLWLCSSLDGPMAWNGVRLDRFEGHPAVYERPCNSIYADSRGRVWIGFLTGGVAVYDPGGFDHGAFTTFGEDDGLTPGTVLSILEDPRGAMWFATPSGLNRYDGGMFLSLTADQAPLVDLVPVLLADDEGFLWVGVDSGAGLVRLQPRQVDDFASGRSPSLEYAYFDETDGMQQGAQAWQVGGVRGPDGRLWVATGLGLVLIDPQRLPGAHRTARPTIESLTVSGQQRALEDDLVLPPRTSTLEIEYASVNLSAASKLRYRHRLDGVDEDWVMAGGARNARYTGLAPGTYQFRVSATDTGRWTDETVLAFSLAPPFYRTPQFVGLALLGSVLLMISAWWLRLRTLRRQYSLVFAERARVSREIHDTLLQSLAAIGVELETIASQTEPTQQVLRGELARLRRRAGHTLREARDSILELRRTPMQRRPPGETLRDLVRRSGARQSVPVTFQELGRRRSTAADIDVQLARIAQEAVNNALRYASPASVTVTLTYEPERVVLSVADDGCGFDPALVCPPSSGGEHFGLVTMQERAERAGGRLTVDSRPGGGTRVEAVLPLGEGEETT
jgi:signal transduction histidine kinase/ligand-binding sensor domain-containing protein